MDTIIYGIKTMTIQLSMKWQFQSYTRFFKNTKANYRKRAIN